MWRLRARFVSTSRIRSRHGVVIRGSYNRQVAASYSVTCGLNRSSLGHNTRSYDRVCLSEFYRRKYAQLLGRTEIAQNIPNGKSDADSKVAV
jgi:hypothetical protein